MNPLFLLHRSSIKGQQQLLFVPRYYLYHSRAHPQPIPEWSIPSAMEYIIRAAGERQVARQQRWERRLQEKPELNPTKSSYRNQDETVEVAVNLNLDPRRPGQALRGSVVLPHPVASTTSNKKILVLTQHPELMQAVKELSTSNIVVGGEDYVDRLASGNDDMISIDQLETVVATQDMMPLVRKSLARILGPQGLMPNSKSGTLFDQDTIDGRQGLLDRLTNQSKTIQYRTDKEGIVHVKLGKISLGHDKLLENLESICLELQGQKPESYGKGKKSSKKMGKNTKYWLSSYLSATQHKGRVRLDLRTVDPSSPFFMQDPDNL